MDTSELADLGAYRSIRDEEPSRAGDNATADSSLLTTTVGASSRAKSYQDSCGRIQNQYPALDSPLSESHYLERTTERRHTFLWSKLGRRLLVHAPPTLLVFGCVPAFLAVYPTIHFDDEPLCDPSGAFNLGFETYNPWLAAAAFVITLPVTRPLSFSTVKSIDIAWDLGVGRGSQAIMGLMSYLVFTKSLSRIMEDRRVKFGAFEAITLQHDRLVGATKIVKHFPTNQGLRTGLIFVSMVLTTAFTLVFPTLAGAMTGYTTSLRAYVEVPDGTLVNSNFEAIRYIIHDAFRLNMDLPCDYPVVTPSWSNGKPFLLDWDRTVNELHKGEQVSGVLDELDRMEQVSKLGNNIPNPCGWETRSIISNITETPRYKDTWTDADKCAFLHSVSNYVSIYGLEGVKNTSWNFTFGVNSLYNMDPPTLNISAYFSWDNTISQWDMSTRLSLSRAVANELVPYGFSWQDPRDGSYPVADTSRALFLNSNDGGQITYSLDELNDHGRCQQEGSLYVWGFSHLLLILCLSGLTLWFTILYALYIDVSMNSVLHANGRDLGTRRAVLDFASAMDAHLKHDCNPFDGDELVNRKTKAGWISYSGLPLDNLDIDRRAVRLREQWLRWW